MILATISAEAAVHLEGLSMGFALGISAFMFSFAGMQMLKLFNSSANS
jgi:hypothetical protein